VRWGNKNYDGLNVKHTSGPMSRISDRIVRDRWNLESETYPALVVDGGRMDKVIDLTWESPARDSVKKTYTTTFVVVPDKVMKCDADFGQNKFEPPLSARQSKGHSVTSMLTPSYN